MALLTSWIAERELGFRAKMHRGRAGLYWTAVEGH